MMNCDVDNLGGEKKREKRHDIENVPCAIGTTTFTVNAVAYKLCFMLVDVCYEDANSNLRKVKRDSFTFRATLLPGAKASVGTTRPLVK